MEITITKTDSGLIIDGRRIIQSAWLRGPYWKHSNFIRRALARVLPLKPNVSVGGQMMKVGDMVIVDPQTYKALLKEADEREAAASGTAEAGEK